MRTSNWHQVPGAVLLPPTEKRDEEVAAETLPQDTREEVKVGNYVKSEHNIGTTAWLCHKLRNMSTTEGEVRVGLR